MSRAKKFCSLLLSEQSVDESWYGGRAAKRAGAADLLRQSEQAKDREHANFVFLQVRAQCGFISPIIQ